MQPKIRCAHSKMVPISDLVLHPDNPNDHTAAGTARLAQVIEYQGFRSPIKVSLATGLITAGHGRLLAAKKLEMTEVPVDYQEYESSEMEYADVVSDNAISEWSTLDLSKINDAVGDLGPDFDIDLLGIDGFEIEVADRMPDEGDEDDIPEEPVEAKSALGDLWVLGNHRLLCGDATDVNHVDRLMDGNKADMLFSDPPYGIGYKYESHDDSDNDLNAQLVWDAFALHDCGKVWSPGKPNLARDIERFGKTKVLCWYKKFAMAGSGLGGASTWEPILVINPTNRKLNNDVIEIKTDRETIDGKSLRDLHSCPKPIGLYETLIKSLSNQGEKIIEPFGGSGSTLIACEKTNRSCYMMELEPKYIDVILTRWAKYSGLDPVRDDGIKWSELASR